MSDRRISTNEHIGRMYQSIGLNDAFRRESVAAHETGKPKSDSLSDNVSSESADNRFFKNLLAKTEVKQHLGTALRQRVIMDSEGIECLVELVPVEQKQAEQNPFSKNSEHLWRMGI